MERVTAPAVPLKGPRAACAMSPVDEALAVTFFFVTLGLPWVLAGLAVYIGMYGTATGFACFILAMLLLAFHPLPTFTHHLRRSRLSLALARYFTMELLIDRGHPIIGLCGTPAVEADEFQKLHLPAVYLACPHGVFNYAAIVWSVADEDRTDPRALAVTPAMALIGCAHPLDPCPQVLLQPLACWMGAIHGRCKRSGQRSRSAVLGSADLAGQRRALEHRRGASRAPRRGVAQRRHDWHGA
jgi:hypothetical protein